MLRNTFFTSIDSIQSNALFNAEFLWLVLLKKVIEVKSREVKRSPAQELGVILNDLFKSDLRRLRRLQIESFYKPLNIAQNIDYSFFGHLFQDFHTTLPLVNLTSVHCLKQMVSYRTNSKEPGRLVWRK